MGFHYFFLIVETMGGIAVGMFLIAAAMMAICVMGEKLFFH